MKLRQSYRNIFTTHEGQAVLADLLMRLHFFDEILNEEEKALHNFAKRLLKILGVYQKKNAQAITQAFLGIPVRVAEEEETNAARPEHDSWDPLRG